MMFRPPIATAVGQQAETVNSVNHNVQEAAAENSGMMSGLEEALAIANHTTKAAADARDESVVLSRMATKLQDLVSAFRF